MGADVFDNPQVAKRNLLWGPGAWGVNLGLHKDFRFGERVNATLGQTLTMFSITRCERRITMAETPSPTSAASASR